MRKALIRGAGAYAQRLKRRGMKQKDEVNHLAAASLVLVYTACRARLDNAFDADELVERIDGAGRSVATQAAVHSIDAGAGDERVGTGFAKQAIGAQAAIERVQAAAAVHRVVAGAALHGVVAGVTVHLIRAAVAE